MSNWQQQPQRWGAPQPPFGQPQQGQGWTQQGGMGGWQQAVPAQGQGFFNPLQQQFPVQPHQATYPPSQGMGGGGGSGGFMAGPGGGHVGTAAGGFPVNQAGMGWGFSGGLPQPLHHQQQFQIMQQQQQQQMAYLQEQQRLAKEERKKRDLEIQKRKLMNINVANPTASASLSFDDLVTVKTSSSSSSRSSSPKVTRQAQDVAVPNTTSTALSVAAVVDDPLPIHSSPLLTSNIGGQSTQTVTPASSNDQNTPKSPSNTFEKLMESSLSNLQDVSPGKSRKADFKASSKAGAKPSPLTSAQKTFLQSTRARAWTADGGDFSGVFSQHTAPPEQHQLQQTTDLLGGDDSFGDFQSVGVGAPGSGTSLVELQGHLSQTSQLGGLSSFHPGQQMLQVQGQSLHLGGVGGGVGMPQDQARLRAATIHIHGGNTLPTSSYQHPIPSISVAERPQSPTGSHFSNLDPSKFPPVYIEVFKRCSAPGEPFLKTELLFPLLMSSQLPKNVLRDLWSLANRAIPGKLNQTELFVLLGLIGLAQSGNRSPTPEDLKKASRLPIPKLSALQETLPPVLPQLPSSSQSHTHAPPPPPMDDFGDFQQGQKSFEPSLPTPPPAPPSQSAKESVSLASALSSNPTGPVGEPPSGDKYSVFDDLRSISSGEAIPVPPSDVMTSSKSSEVVLQLPLATTTTAGAQGMYASLNFFQAVPITTSAPIVGKADDFGSFSSVPLSSSSSQKQDDLLAFTSSAPSVTGPPSDGGFADFASFQQASTSSSSSLGLGPSIATAPVVDNSNQGWAAFADFASSSSQVISSQQGPSFPPPSPLSSSTTSPAVSSSNAARSKADSAFDCLLPPELLPSKASKGSESEPKSVEAVLSSSLDGQPLAATSTTATLNFGIFESNVSLESGKKREQKLLTGLEVLEEEFSARVSAKVLSSPATLSMEEPLVPESSPLDDFGEFEAFSSTGIADTDKMSSFPPSLTGVSTGGEPSPSLRKKSSSDPIRVWSSCLTKCSEVLESCVNVFSEVKEQSVLEEIAQAEEGRNKLKGIVEVYRLAKLVYRPFREKKEGAEGENSVQSIQKQWKRLVNLLPNNAMSQLYAETTPACVEEEDVLSDSISKCSLCLSSKNVSIPPHLSLDGKKEEYTSSLLFHSGQSYHSTCANFWLNVVQEELPVLL